MFELTIPTGFTQVTDLSVLSLSGSRSANYFFAGDKITVSDKVYSQLRPSATQTDESGKPKMQPVYYALVNITNAGSDKGYDKLLPLAAFRRLPKDSETFLATAGDLMRQLAGMSSDRERFDLLKGKTVKVTRLEDGEAFDYSASNFATREYKYRKSKFAVLEFEA